MIQGFLSSRGFSSCGFATLRFAICGFFRVFVGIVSTDPMEPIKPVEPKEFDTLHLNPSFYAFCFIKNYFLHQYLGWDLILQIWLVLWDPWNPFFSSREFIFCRFPFPPHIRGKRELPLSPQYIILCPTPFLHLENLLNLHFC